MAKKSEKTDEVIRLFEDGYWIDEIADMTGYGVEDIKMRLTLSGRSVAPIPIGAKYQEEFCKAWNKAVRRFREWKKLQGES